MRRKKIKLDLGLARKKLGRVWELNQLLSLDCVDVEVAEEYAQLLREIEPAVDYLVKFGRIDQSVKDDLWRMLPTVQLVLSDQ